MQNPLHGTKKLHRFIERNTLTLPGKLIIIQDVMKKIFLIITIISAAYSFSYSQDKGWGAGIIVGEPTGISVKYWLNGTNALDYGLGSSFAANSRIHLHVDYLWHMYDVFQSTETFVLYYGPGLRVKTRKDGDSNFGIRGVMGVNWFVKTSPLDVFAEVVPVLDLAPDLRMTVNAGIGVRYFFN